MSKKQNVIKLNANIFSKEFKEFITEDEMLDIIDFISESLEHKGYVMASKAEIK